MSAQKNAAWSNIARYMAHEIKNPLTPIKISAQRIQSSLKSKTKANLDFFDSCSNTIIRQVNNIENLVSEFSNFARMPESNLELTKLDNIINTQVNTQKIANKNITFNVEVAKTIEERKTGLMYRKKLLNNEGMLFIFPREKIIRLWMKNTYIPLDVIFISENNVIVDIKKNMEKLSETIVKSKVKSRYALEFNAGLINKLDIEIGDKILFNE